MPKVTILMTVYNNEKYIRTAIFSILNQTFKDIELLLINDCSTDNTDKIISSFNDKRIRYYKNNKNIGISHSLNKGIALANGKYTARMDGDDICYPQRIERQVSYLDRNKDYGLVGSWYYVINEIGALRTVKRKATNDNDIRLSMLFENQFIQSSVMMRADLLKDLMYDTGLEVCEDYDLFMRVLYRCKVANLPEELITYRWYGGNTSIIKQKSILESFVQIFSKTLDHYSINHTKEELFIHSILAFRYAKKYFNTTERIDQLNNWLDKIRSSPNLLSLFDETMIEKKLDAIRQDALAGMVKPVDF